MEKISLFILKKNKKTHNMSYVIKVSNGLYKFVMHKDNLVLKKTNHSSLRSDDYFQIDITISGEGSFQHDEAKVREVIAYIFSNLSESNNMLAEDSELSALAVKILKSSDIVLG